MGDIVAAHCKSCGFEAQGLMEGCGESRVTFLIIYCPGCKRLGDAEERRTPSGFGCAGCGRLASLWGHPPGHVRGRGRDNRGVCPYCEMINRINRQTCDFGELLPPECERDPTHQPVYLKMRVRQRCPKCQTGVLYMKRYGKWD